jgi:nucleotide sugar dehydrogenase
MAKQRIGVVGFGVVGKAVAEFWTNHGHEVAVFDVAMHGEPERAAVNGCEFAFLCVPTPMGADGTCQTTAIDEVTAWCEAEIMIIRSTVAVGTTEHLRANTGKRIVFQPEFLGETPWSHFETHTDAIVLGGEKSDTRPVVKLYQTILGPAAIYRQVPSSMAEMMKYTINCYLASKVAFFNEIYDIAEVADVDFDELRELVLLDDRISATHSMVTKERGFGGKCLPKDLSALICTARALGYDPVMLAAVFSSNEMVRRAAEENCDE